MYWLGTHGWRNVLPQAVFRSNNGWDFLKKKSFHWAALNWLTNLPVYTVLYFCRYVVCVHIYTLCLYIVLYTQLQLTQQQQKIKTISYLCSVRMRTPYCPQLTLSLLHSHHTRHFSWESTAGVAVETVQSAWRQIWLMAWFKTGVALVPWWGSCNTQTDMLMMVQSQRRRKINAPDKRLEITLRLSLCVCVCLWLCEFLLWVTQGYVLILAKV